MRAYTIQRHQDKAKAYIAALRRAGYVRVLDNAHAKFHLAHLYYANKPNSIRTRKVQEILQRNLPVFVYPHHARPTIEWDGVNTYLTTHAAFVQAPGHAEVMGHFYPYPVEVVGWTYSEIKPPRGPLSATWPLRVLFGPIHPFGNGYQGPTAAKLNQAVFTELSKLHIAGAIDLTVRHVKPLETNGIFDAGQTSVKFHQALTRLEPSVLEDYDVVVGHQTIAYVAVALGVPTVMFGQDDLPEIISAWKFQPPEANMPAHWKDYADLMRYPVDFFDADPLAILERALRVEATEQTWRHRFIGAPFDPVHFVERLEAYL